ncbi:AraC family transcriptional regulator ligand-binding domain-containing protein [Salipiger sp. 1_MG-2023]|uniref:AraC family transcriptional regulator ligand-binding domain-containing protein n=1 Tax=Salipiger sp. 1_MG-2023 TaxID=3062665 RepID=UPI0034C637BD
MRSLARRCIPLLQADFRCSALGRAVAYSCFFGTPAQFDAAETRVLIGAEYLSLPVNRTEAALKRYLKDAGGHSGRGLARFRQPRGAVDHAAQHPTPPA